MVTSIGSMPPCLRRASESSRGFASRLVMSGVDLRTVAELMGHKTIQMTMRYAHLAPAHQLAAVERLTSFQLPAAEKNGDEVPPEPSATTSATGPEVEPSAKPVMVN